jgi:hypothetical protein
MSYEIFLSDEANQPDDEVRSILGRISRSAEFDHVLSAENFELRYQELGGTYVFFRRDETAQRVNVIYFCEMRVPVVGNPEARVLELKTRDIPHGMEAEAWVEKTRLDGSTVQYHYFARKLDMGDSYMTVNHTPAGTFLITGKKGRVEGDFRHDELEMVHLHRDGTVQHFPWNTVPVWIKQFEGIPPVAQKWQALA